MDKKNKKILIILTSLLVLSALFISVGLWHYWNTDPEPICNRAGGWWGPVEEGHNLCDKNSKQSDKLIFGCWCGLDGCWDGKKCVDRPQKLYLMIKNIDEKVQLINLEKDYEIKTLNNEKFLDHMTDGGGQLIGYFKDGKINKIVERLGLSYGIMTYEYYFSNEQLILVKEIEEDFPDTNYTGTLDYTKVEIAFEGYHYFDNEKFLDTQTKGKKRFSPDVTASDVGLSFITKAKQNVELLLEAK